MRDLRGKLLSIFCIAYALFTVVSLLHIFMTPFQQIAIFLSFSLSCVFLRFPLVRRDDREAHAFSLVADFLLVLLGWTIGIYIYVEELSLIYRIGEPNTWDMICGVSAMLLVLEGTRRSAGWALIFVAIFALLFGFYGLYFPGILKHPGYDLEQMVNTMYLTAGGIFSIPLRVMLRYVFIFIMFGAFMEILRGNKFFMDLALSLTGQMRGGPAKVAVLASGFLGSINGSAAANVATTGVFTVPMMKSIGYKPHQAGAIEAAASTGGQILPPVMGSVAFVMAEYLGVPYLEVVKVAILPGALYFLSVGSVVHFEAAKAGMQGIPRSQLPHLWSVMKNGWHFFLPIGVILYYLFTGSSIIKVGTHGFFSLLMVSMLRKDTRITLKKGIDGLIQTGKVAAPLCCASATAGIVLGVIGSTGTAIKMSSLVVALSHGSLLLTLMLSMVLCLLLGMGTTTTVCYVVLATLIAPALVDIGVEPLLAHLFLLYFGVFSMVTPPVGMSFYAAAALAESSPMKTGMTSVLFASAGVIIPYFFIYNPALALMHASLSEIVLAALSASIGVICFAGAITGFMKRRCQFWERITLFVAALTLIKSGFWTDIVGLTLLASVLAFQYLSQGTTVKSG